MWNLLKVGGGGDLALEVIDHESQEKDIGEKKFWGWGSEMRYLYRDYLEYVSTAPWREEN